MTQTVTVTPPATGPAGPNDAALAAKMDAANAPPAPPQDTPQGTPERPTWLPEKFKSPEDLAKAYSELEKKASGAKPSDAAPPADKAKDQPADAPNADDASKALADKGLDMAQFSAEFEEKGELSPESFEKLAKAGIPREMVDGYIAGQQAQANALVTELQGIAGGAEGFTAMAAWAASALSEAELSAYNEAVSQSPAAARLAVAGLHARFAAAEGSPAARTVAGNGNAGATTEEYASWEQAKADQRSPEYRKDPAFRSKVAEKIMRSKALV
jgi:hypothetical protein